MNANKDSLNTPMENLARLRRCLIAISSLLTCGVLVALLALTWWTSAKTAHDSDVATLDDLVFNTRVNIDDFSGFSSVREAYGQGWDEWDQEVVNGSRYASGYAVDSMIWRGLRFASNPILFMRMQDGSIRFLRTPLLGNDVDLDDVEALIAEATRVRESSGPNLPAQTIEFGGGTWMWTTYVAALNPKVDEAAMDEASDTNSYVSFFTSGDLQDYLDNGMLAGRIYGFVDIEPSLIAAEELAKQLAGFGLVGCVLLILVCRWVVTRAFAPVEAAQERQREFIGQASHELKTPLASLTSNLDALVANGGETVESQTCWTDNMRADIDQMAGLACTLLELVDAKGPMDEAGKAQPAEKRSEA